MIIGFFWVVMSDWFTESASAVSTTPWNSILRFLLGGAVRLKSKLAAI